MHPIIRNILAVIAGAILGGVVNMAIVNLSGSIIPPPEGTDTSTMEGLKEAMRFFEPKHFIMPFLAHAIGTFVGALIAALIAANNKMIFALLVGILFLIGGIVMVFMVPSPTWFIILDLVVAYIPMAWLGGKLAGSIRKR